MEHSNLLKVKIREIGPGAQDLLLTGVIIRKQDCRIVHIKKGNREKCVWSFTFRDTPSDIINVSFWGSVQYIVNISKNFQIGDVVDLINVRAAFRKIDEKEDMYQPAATSSFSISMNEDTSTISMHINKESLEAYKRLLFLPSKPAGNFLTISDINRNGQVLKGQFVNLLAAIQDVGEIREFKSKNGKFLNCRDIKLIDETYSTTLLTLWDADLLALSRLWKSEHTVLFLADVRVNWNEFRKTIITSTTRRTVVTVDPLTIAAENLRSFIHGSAFQCSIKTDRILNKYSDPALINTVVSCHNVKIQAKCEEYNKEFTALVYAVINSFDIDGTESFILTKCTQCNRRVDPLLELCLNAECPAATGVKSPNIDNVYDIRISLTDHTGTLHNCKIPSSVAQNMIGCKASVFQTLSDDEKTSIKWQYLLKYCAARLVVVPYGERSSPLVSVVSIGLLSTAKYSSKIPMC